MNKNKKFNNTEAEISSESTTNTDVNMNLNISTLDETNNDFLFSWKEFNTRPNRISIPGKFDASSLWTYIEREFSYKENDLIIEKDILTEGDVIITHKKILFKLNDKNTIVTFRQMDEYYKDTDETVIDIYGITIFYKELSDFIVLIEDDLVQMSDSESGEQYNEFKEAKNKILKFDTDDGKFSLELLDQDMNIDYDNIELYYNSETYKQVKKWFKKIKNTKKGLSLVFGERGYGKTSLASYMMRKLHNKFIYIPSHTIEHVLHNPEFIEFLKFNKDTVYIIDDCENYFNKTYQKTTIVVNNLLQMIDGIKSDTYNAHFILLLNSSKNFVDDNLLDCNNLVDTIQLEELSIEESDTLSEHLRLDIKHNTKRKLNDVIKGIQNPSKAIGYL